MFKNFGKVFKFTFRNQTTSDGYMKLTIITALLLIIIPIAIFVLSDKLGDDESEDELKPCGADKIYVVNEAHPKVNYGILNMLNVDDYTSIAYENADSVTDALKTINEKSENKSFVIQLTESDTSINSRIILPENSDISEDDAENFNKFLNMNSQTVAFVASDLKLEELQAVSVKTSSNVYTSSGYDEGVGILDDKDAQDEQMSKDATPVFNMILVFVTAMVVYFVIIFYGNGIMQNIVLEKSSKLMDTMLISVKPEAMIFGKMLGVLSAALLQFFTWIFSLVLGLAAGVFIINKINPDNEMMAVAFLSNLNKMGLFKPVSVIIAVLTLLFGIVFYSAIASICGAISSTKEEAASNQSLFVMALLVSFYLVLFFGLKGEDVATWMYLLPFTSSMVLPAGVCSGTVPVLTAAIGLLIMIVATVLLVILAGKLYKMMSLYKGNKVNLAKALKMLKQ